MNWAWLAQEVPQLPPWATWGVLGLVIFALIIGQIVPGYLYKQAKADRDIALAELSVVRQKMEDSIIPALVRATDAITKLARENGVR